MLLRRIEKEIDRFFGTEKKKVLLITGARQVGKTYIIRECARKHFESVVEINFLENKNARGLFADFTDSRDILLRLSALTDKPLIKGQTLIFFDEVQECRDLVTAVKFLVEEGSYRYVMSGSLLGVELKDIRSMPVGYMDIMEMFPLNFMEFCMANRVSDGVLGLLKDCFDRVIPVDPLIHEKMMELFRLYLITGGMPDVVQTFVDTKQMNDVLSAQRDIVRSYEDDMVKYAEKKDKSHIKECFQSIPRQLGKENKKFQYSVVRKGATASKYAGSLQWIEDAGIISRCRNLSITELPLDGNAQEDVFKVYMKDCGLFASMLEDGTQYEILQGNLFGYKGAIFENLIADIFAKMGRKLYYFHKDSGMEVDFVIRYKGECTLVEVKAATGNTKSTKTILNHPEKYHVHSAVKLGDYNVGRSGPVLTLPLYLAFLLRET